VVTFKVSCFLVYVTDRASFHAVLLQHGAALSCNNGTNIVNTTCTINVDAADSDSSSKHLDLFDSGTSDLLRHLFTPRRPPR
jgi:hypothetical protein